MTYWVHGGVRYNYLYKPTHNPYTNKLSLSSLFTQRWFCSPTPFRYTSVCPQNDAVWSVVCLCYICMYLHNVRDVYGTTHLVRALNCVYVPDFRPTQPHTNPPTHTVHTNYDVIMATIRWHTQSAWPPFPRRCERTRWMSPMANTGLQLSNTAISWLQTHDVQQARWRHNLNQQSC